MLGKKNESSHVPAVCSDCLPVSGHIDMLCSSADSDWVRMPSLIAGIGVYSLVPRLFVGETFVFVRPGYEARIGGFERIAATHINILQRVAIYASLLQEKEASTCTPTPRSFCCQKMSNELERTKL